jgi:sugar O-acyltransferase (sialic acid O-acetyltransferase NeuD family)
MIVYGASGHGKVIIEILESVYTPVIEVWDDADKDPIWEYAVTKPLPTGVPVRDKMVISIGANATRKKVAERLGGTIGFGKAVHAATCISNRAKVNEGTVIMAGATVNADTTIGRHCIINTNASIDHDCVIGDFAHISPNATLSGDVQVGEGTHIGAGASVIQGIRIGNWCTIGAGTVVIRDIPDHSTAVGNPARIIKTTKP